MKLVKYAKFREEKFGGVLFETRSEKVFTLNSTAAAVVCEIEAGRDERDIIKRLPGLLWPHCGESSGKRGNSNVCLEQAKDARTSHRYRMVEAIKMADIGSSFDCSG